jgi:hypothetical protein
MVFYYLETTSWFLVIEHNTMVFIQNQYNHMNSLFVRDI